MTRLPSRTTAKQVESRRRASAAPDPEEAARRRALEHAKLRRMVEYADTGACLRATILRYFGDEQETLGGCGHCDVCLALDGATTEESDAAPVATVAATKDIAQAQPEIRWRMASRRSAPSSLV